MACFSLDLGDIRRTFQGTQGQSYLLRCGASGSANAETAPNHDINSILYGKVKV